MSSLAEVLGLQNGALTPVPPEALYLWLPELQTPAGWVDTTAAAPAPVARMLVRRAAGSGPWDACELLNLYRVPGLISPETLLDNADRALRHGGATDIHTYRRDDVPTTIDGMMAVRVSGRLAAGGREVRAVYNYYAVNTSVGAALIEQASVIGDDAPDAVALEVECLAESVYQSLIASLHSAVPATQPSGRWATGNPLAAATHTGLVTSSPTVTIPGPGLTDGAAKGVEFGQEPLPPATTIAAAKGLHGAGSDVGPGR